MDKINTVLSLVEAQTSADNNVRKDAEAQFEELVEQNPNDIFFALIQVPMDENYPQAIRQACLLHLRRLIPYYWSLAFGSFKWQAISSDLKKVIRLDLLQLVSTSPSSKIRNLISYLIVQIAVADYPDEWPDLLDVLYEMSCDFLKPLAVEGSIQVLKDVFEDLVTDEQFWGHQNIGSLMVQHLGEILKSDISASCKMNAVLLYKNVLSYFSSPVAFANDHNKKTVYENIPIICETLFERVKASVEITSHQLSTGSIDIVECGYREAMYSLLSTLIGEFNKKISKEYKKYLLLLILEDFALLKIPSLQIEYEQFRSDLDLQVRTDPANEYEDPVKVLLLTIRHLLRLLTLLQHSIKLDEVLDDASYQTLVSHFISVSTLESDIGENNYSSNYGDFVWHNGGIGFQDYVRDDVQDFFSELNNHDSNKIFNYLLSEVQKNDPWEFVEAKLYILESILRNEDSELAGDVGNFYEFITQFLTTDDNHKLNSYQFHNAPVLVARIFLLLPKLLEKFQDRITAETVTFHKESLSAYNNNVAAFMFSYTVFVVSNIDPRESWYNYLKVAALIPCPDYRDLVNFETDFSESNAIALQLNIFKIITHLVEADLEERAMGAFFEALEVAIGINPNLAAKWNSGTTAIELILTLGFRDPYSFNSVQCGECLSTLLSKVNIDEYVCMCELALPLFVDAIGPSDEFVRDPETEGRLFLVLDLLEMVIGSVPSVNGQKVFPDKFFNFVYPDIKKLLLFDDDGQTLKCGSSVLNSLIQYAPDSFIKYKDPESNESGIESLLAIVSRFLSPELSDLGAAHCGTLVTSLIEHFQQQLGDQYLSQILATTVRRLLLSRDVVTIENLVMVFCSLVLLLPELMINYLGNELVLEDHVSGSQRPALELILPIWFQSFEVTRGYENIKKNVLALGQIFSLAGHRVQNLIVDGDLIPYEGDKILTRSMAKEMPDKYTQIPAPLKILKLLVGELDFQCQQPSAKDYLPDREESDVDDNEEGWEDIDDIGIPNYDKLKSYVDSDDEDDEDSKDDDLKKLLIQFFKECAGKNLGNFLEYYEQLSEDEKRIITENVLFN